MANESFEKLEVDGTQIAYRRLGNGRPLLVLNGFAATSSDWDHGLASYSELILLDNRGIGDSTDDERPFDIARLANDAAHVIETLGFERISMLGWSMGGFVSQTLALQQPNRVNKLICYQRISAVRRQISLRRLCGHNSSILPARLTT